MTVKKAQSEIYALLVAADGEIDGRIRLQKIAYLLQQKSHQNVLNFIYHHYGPFCRELNDALDLAVSNNKLEEKKVNTSFGTSYSAFKLRESSSSGIESFVGQPMEQAKHLVAKLKMQPSVILELAATIHWLKEKEEVDDWRRELKIRKTIKATDQNIARAERVLAELGLAA